MRVHAAPGRGETPAAPRGQEQKSGASLPPWPLAVLQVPRWVLGKEESAIFVGGPTTVEQSTQGANTQEKLPNVSFELITKQ